MDARRISRQLVPIDPDLLAQAAVVTAALAQLPTAALGASGRGGTPTVE